MPSGRKRRILLAIFTYLAVQPAIAAGPVVYVSEAGNDAWDGTAGKPGVAPHGPVRSLERARDIVRGLRRRQPALTAPVKVVIAPGSYFLTEVLRLTPEDSGTAISPTIYTATTPRSVTLLGGVRLVSDGWSEPDATCAPCRAHPEIRQFQLPRKIVEVSAEIAEEGFGHVVRAQAAELLMDGRRMPPARWPDADFAKLQEVDSKNVSRIRSSQPLPLSISGARSLWARGFWKHDWADISAPVKTIDVSSGWMQLEHAIAPYGVAKGARFYLFNALELLDQPDEWFLDRVTGRLYFYAPADIEKRHVVWPVLENIVLLEGVHDVHFEGIDFSASRGDAILAQEVESVAITDCRIYGIGGWAAALSGRNSGLSRCELSQLGEGGVRLRGGKRTSLQSGGMYVIHSRIHNFSTRVYTMRPAISLEGVGARVEDNVIAHGPHMAIYILGNNHRIERNEIFDVVNQTSDAGAIYIGRDWTARGTVIRQNYIHDIQALPGFEVKGIYLDDQASGIGIYENVFWGVMQPVFVGGGSDNVVKGNAFIASSPAISLDRRGLGWQKAATLDPNGALQSALRAVPYESSEAWRKAFPELLKIRSDGYGKPMRNKFVANAFLGSHPYQFALRKSELDDQQIEPADATEESEVPSFGRAPSDVAALCRSPAWISRRLAICRSAKSIHGN